MGIRQGRLENSKDLMRWAGLTRKVCLREKRNTEQKRDGKKGRPKLRWKSCIRSESEKQKKKTPGRKEPITKQDGRSRDEAK